MADEIVESNKFQCNWEECGLVFKSNSALNRHKALKKHVDASKAHLHTGNLMCPIDGCRKRFSRMVYLCGHLREEHGEVNAVIEHQSFLNFNQFLKWKMELERRTVSSYVLHSSIKPFHLKKHGYFYCHRSGQKNTLFNPHKKRVRALKSQGVCKIEETCSAFMKVTEDLATGEVTVEYCQHHTGHSLDIGHLRLPDELKTEIALMLQKGESVSKVMDSVREKYNRSNMRTLDRGHILRRVDVRNVMKSFNTGGTQKSRDDHLSVSIWVEQLNSLDDFQPVLLYKSRGSTEEIQDGAGNLSASDFILCLQTRAQRQLLQQFGNGRLVCIDTVRDACRYNYILVTLIVVDDFGEGIPVAYMISNRDDEVVLCTFFRAIKSRLPETMRFSASHLLCDNSERYFTAWKQVFGFAKRRLSAWHLEHHWQQAVKKCGASCLPQSDQDEVCDKLHRLLWEIEDETEFQVSLASFSEWIAANVPAFADYFMQFRERTADWAYCRGGDDIQKRANMYVENFHSQLAPENSHGKLGRRIDSTIHILLHIARYKTLERIVKGTRHSLASHINGVTGRHEIVTTAIPATTGGGWLIPSSAESKMQSHLVLQAVDSCDCQLRCRECNCCPHIYMCSCVEFAVYATVCKHVHTIHALLNSITTPSDALAGEEMSVPMVVIPADDETAAYVSYELQCAEVTAESCSATACDQDAGLDMVADAAIAETQLNSLRYHVQVQCQQIAEAAENCADPDYLVQLITQLKAVHENIYALANGAVTTTMQVTDGEIEHQQQSEEACMQDIQEEEGVKINRKRNHVSSDPAHDSKKKSPQQFDGVEHNTFYPINYAEQYS